MLNIKGALVRNTANPALGPGRILGSDNRGRLIIGLLWEENSYAIDTANASIERYVLFGFAPVKFKAEGSEEFTEGFVLSSKDPDAKGVWNYDVAVKSEDDWTKTSIPETDLIPLPPRTNDPIEYLRTLMWQGPKRFVRRWKMLLIESGWLEDSGGIPALLGARIHPMGHQLYAARRILWDRVPRFILADEVGLGKTIEAGLVIQALRAEKPNLRVLIVTPGSMARQWQTELYLRFGAQAYAHLDSSSMQKLPSTGLRKELTRDQLIVTATALQTFADSRRILTEQQWDLVIIDEAHQFPPGSEFYSFLYLLSRKCHGLLALSATPSKREITSLAGLLALVTPEAYKADDVDSLVQRLSSQRDIWDRLSFTRKYLEAAHREGTLLEPEDLVYLAEQWEGLLGDDDTVLSLISDLRNGRADAVDDLIAYVQEFHRLDHRIIRTRRVALEDQEQHWSKRVFELLEYEPDDDESVLANHLDELVLPKDAEPTQLALHGLYNRVFNTTPSFLLGLLNERRNALSNLESRNSILPDPIGLLTADPGPADEELLIKEIVKTTPPLPNEENWLKIAQGLAENWKDQQTVSARTLEVSRWIRQHLNDSQKNQVLVFAQDRTVVVELTQELQRQLKVVPVKSFHHGMSESDLAKVALQFQRNENCQVLVSDELGGEGRNFQNASALVHFDLPWSVSRLEQRIGRLDRVGRGTDRPVNSVVLFGPSALEQSIFAIHSGVFKVLTQSVGGIEFALPGFQRALNEAICLGPDHVHELGKSLASQVEAELHDVDEAFELSLDASKLRLGEGQALAEWLSDAEDSNSKKDDQTLVDWARSLGINTKRQGDSAWQFKWSAEELHRRLKFLRTTGFMTGTFDRLRALNDDTQQFFSPGHPLVDALAEDVRESGEGRATVIFLKFGSTYRGRLFAMILSRCALNDGVKEELSLSPGLILRAQRFLWPEIVPTVFELHPGQTPSATAVLDAGLNRALCSPSGLVANGDRIPPNTLHKGLDDVQSLWLATEDAITLALETVRQQRREKTQRAADRLDDDLRSEISYLNWLRQRQGQEQALKTAREIEARKLLINSVRTEKVSAEAVAVIVAS